MFTCLRRQSYILLCNKYKTTTCFIAVFKQNLIHFRQSALRHINILKQLCPPLYPFFFPQKYKKGKEILYASSKKHICFSSKACMFFSDTLSQLFSVQGGREKETNRL